jgi:hypothetical protein
MSRWRFLFKIVVLAPFVFVALQSFTWYMGISSFGTLLLSTQIAVLTLELRRYLWSERDVHEAEFTLFRK